MLKFNMWVPNLGENGWIEKELARADDQNNTSPNFCVVAVVFEQ